jgi:hypothetical protein
MNSNVVAPQMEQILKMDDIREKMLCKTDKSSASSIEIKHLQKLNRDLQKSDDEGKFWEC